MEKGSNFKGMVGGEDGDENVYNLSASFKTRLIILSDVVTGSTVTIVS